MLSYAAVPLLLPDAPLLASVQRYLSWDWIAEAEIRTWPAEGLPLHGHVPSGPVRLNVLRWPSRASRFATFHGLIEGDDLDTVRDSVFLNNGYQSAPFVLDDGTQSITTSLYMLPARPLDQIEDAGQLYLLTLVDARYFWWLRAGSITVDAGTTTWADLYEQIGDVLGVTINDDAVASAYPLPGTDLATQYEPMPIVLDAVATSVGQVITRGLDGTVRAENVSTSLATQALNLALEPKVKGGTLALTP